jgi:hypothetical protein
MRFVHAALAILVLSAVPASAGVYSDDLSKCLVSATSDQDRIDLLTWIFAAIAANPSVKQYANISDQQRDTINRTNGALLTRLLGQDCHSQVVDALKYEGASALSSSFNLLGQVAMRGLMNDPAVAQSLGAIDKDLDAGLLAEPKREAGISQ